MTQDASVALVTGGSGGIAPAVAKVLIEEGHHVVLTARRDEPLKAAADKLATETGADVVAIASDALDPASIKALVQTVLDRFGRIDILVNAAASSTPIGGAIEEVNVSALIGDLDTKVGGYLRYSQAVVPAMKAHAHGRIVNIGGLTGRSSDTLSGLRNAAVTHLTKVLADQLGPTGITVNAVHPGIVRTPHLDELFAEMAHDRASTPEKIEAEFVAEIPTRRVLQPEEIGRAIAFLVSPHAASVNGESVTVDGGYSRGIYL